MYGRKGILKGLAAMAPAFATQAAFPVVAGIMSHAIIRYQQKRDAMRRK